VTRLDANASSRIPRTQSLEELQASIDAEIKVKATQPVTNLPPVCESSATGISQ